MYATGRPSTSLNHCRAFLRLDTTTATVSMPTIVNVGLSYVFPQFQSNPHCVWYRWCANAGARLETRRTFDHWPMIAQVAGYEVRKHETFRIESVAEDRFVFTFPPEEARSIWHRID